MRGYGWGLIALAVGLAGGLIVLRLHADPNVIRYAILALAAALVPLIVWARSTRFANPLLLLVSLLLAFDAVDAVAAALLDRGDHAVLSGGASTFVGRDPVLGYAPRPGGRQHVSAHNGKSTVYDVDYTIDGSGYRVTHGAAAPDADTVVFFGDSFTYGEGLNDDQTLPQQYADAEQSRIKVINSGFSGYGAHQVLHLIQSGRLDGQLGHGRRLFVYTAIEEHLMRDEGLGTWDFWGPRYVLDGDGVRYTGPFHSELGGRLVAAAAKSGVVALVRDQFFWEPSPAGPRLFGAITQAAAEEAMRRDHAQFVVLLWDEPFLWDMSRPGQVARHAALVEQMAREMSRRGVGFIRISSLVPDYQANMKAYVIGWDGHPSSLFNHRLALALAARFDQSSSNSPR